MALAILGFVLTLFAWIETWAERFEVWPLLVKPSALSDTGSVLGSADFAESTTKVCAH